MRLAVGDGLPRDGHGIRALRHGEDRQSQLLAHDLQLLDGCRSVDIGRHEQRLLALLLQREAELARRRRLAGALQAHHHDDRRRLRAHADAALRAAHELRELLVDDLHDHLRRGQRLQHVLAHGPLFHGLDEVLDDLEVDIGLEERHAHLAHGLVDIILRQLAVTAQLLERRLQAIG